jgi:prephenate dehydrogenase
MNLDRHNNVVIIGGAGEFGQFLRHDILPSLSVDEMSVIERDTPREEHAQLLQAARHIVLTTPLAGYAERACELVYQSRELKQATTLWFVPSVQSGVWRAVSATLELVANEFLSAVFIHPMYGPNGFRETEPEARTFQNVLTGVHSGKKHDLAEEVNEVSNRFVAKFNITTTTSFNPDEHDRVTAYSQGLSYCVGKLMFDRPDLSTVLHEALPDLHRSFTANHDLILDFLRINSYMPQVIAAFAESWRQTDQSSLSDILKAFATADAALNRGSESPISTKWYEKLRAAVRSSARA